MIWATPTLLVILSQGDYSTGYRLENDMFASHLWAHSVPTEYDSNYMNYIRYMNFSIIFLRLLLNSLFSVNFRWHFIYTTAKIAVQLQSYFRPTWLSLGIRKWWIWLFIRVLSIQKTTRILYTTKDQNSIYNDSKRLEKFYQSNIHLHSKIIRDKMKHAH